MTQLTVVPEASLAETAAERVTTAIAHAVDAHGSAVVSLTGGDTSRLLYERLADLGKSWRQRIDWSRVHLFWGDERHVPPEHRDSNFGMARDALVAHVPIPPAQVHRMRGELQPAQAAADHYQRELIDGFTRAGRSGTRFDLMLLGLGPDAHIASIFPDSPLLAAVDAHQADETVGRSPVERSIDASSPPVAAVYAEHLQAWRITLTPAAILDADLVLMLVAGEDKADAVRAALELPLDVRRYPVQMLRQPVPRRDAEPATSASGNDDDMSAPLEAPGATRETDMTETSSPRIDDERPARPRAPRVEWIIDRAAASRLRGAPPA